MIIAAKILNYQIQKLQLQNLIRLPIATCLFPTCKIKRNLTGGSNTKFQNVLIKSRSDFTRNGIKHRLAVLKKGE